MQTPSVEISNAEIQQYTEYLITIRLIDIIYSVKISNGCHYSLNRRSV